MRLWIVTSITALSVSIGAVPGPATVATGARTGSGDVQAIRWYDSYAQALRDIRAENWPAALQALLAARQSGGPQGPYVMFPGEIYQPFIPDYYLGVVYLKLEKWREAEAAFNTVRARGLIEQKDRLIATFEQNAKLATYNRATSDVKTMIAAKDFAGADKAIGEASDTRVNDPAVKDLRRDLDAAVATERALRDAAAAGATRTNPPAGTGPPPVTTPDPNVSRGRQGEKPTDPDPDPPNRGTGGAPANAGNRGAATPVALGTGTVGSGTSRGRPADPALAAEQALAEQRWADGLRAFLAGDYERAANSLELASASPTASPRVKLYLACANAAKVLTGRADASLLALARAQYNAADPQRNLLDEDRRYISPGLLERLK